MKKPILIGGGIVLLVLLLGGAAYVGGRLLSGEGIPGLTSGGARKPNRDILPAKELPQTSPDVQGIFDHRQDQSIFVGTGNITGSKSVDSSGNVHVSLSHDGPVIEVVVTTQTKIYRDVTQEQYNGRPPDRVQQVVEPGTVGEMGQLSMITVWGRRTGDRYIADVLVYTPPPVLNK
jgi:hypothetical protein